jgi:GntR family transcriptional regulator
VSSEHTAAHTEQFVIDLDSPLPLYYQIQQNITALISSQVLQVGEVLPSERDLSARYGVNRITVRQAINGLCSDGILERRRGIGTFIAQPKRPPSLSPSVAGFSERIRGSGMRPTSRVLSFEVVPSTPTIAQNLNLQPTEPVLCLKRLRFVDGEPLMIETSYLPHDPLQGLMAVDFNANSLYETLNSMFGMPVIEADHTLEPTLLQPDEGRAFGLKAGQPAMLVHVVAYTSGHSPIEFSKAVVRGDRCRYYFTARVEVGRQGGQQSKR